LHHEEPAEYLEPGRLEYSRVDTGWMKQELRFNAVDLGRVDQRFEKMF
jgi:hypothetical protein